MSPGTPIRVLDLGCGTGNCAVELSKLWEDHSQPLQNIGLDFSPAMLKLSEDICMYSQLVEADISKPFQVPGGNVQFLMAAGLFLEGHVSPEAMPFSFQHVEVGGFISISVRGKTYQHSSLEYKKFFEESGCVVVENFLDTYFDENLVTKANYIVLQKVRSS